MLEKATALASRAQGLEPYCGALGADLQKVEELLCICQVGASAATDPIGAASATTTANTSDTSVCSDSYGVAAACTVNFESRAAAAVNATPPGWDTIHAAFSSYEPVRLPRCGKDADIDAQNEVKAVRKLVKDKLKKLAESGFNASEAEVTADFAKLYPLFKYLTELVCEFDARYAQKKKNKGLLDFNDLEHFCLKVLLEEGVPTAAAGELSEKYEEILVDEYQDSNLIQELILGTVSGNREGRFNIFMVGDVKQSIYRFRQAKPELFLSKYLTYPRESGYDARVIQLYKNFRSRPEVIHGVNFVFKQIMSSLVGELDYTDEEALNTGAVFDDPEPVCTVGGSVELHIIDVTSTQSEISFENSSNDVPGASGNAEITDIPGDIGSTGSAGTIDNTGNGSNIGSIVNTDSSGNGGKPTAHEPDAGSTGMGSSDSSEENEEEPLDHIQAEARIVGKRIHALVSRTSEGFHVYDKKLAKYRPAEFRDIVILMRATRNWADIFSDELAAMGIPAYADAGMGYFKTVEIETMLSLLQIIDNPLQDIPLLAVLRSPIGDFSVDELADIRLADRRICVYEAMKLYAGEMRSDISEVEFTASKAESDAGEMQSDIAKSESCTGETESTEHRNLPKYSQMCLDQDQVQANLTEGQKKAGRFLKQLQTWRDYAQYMPTDELVWLLLTETGYYSYVGVLPGGVERQANLRMLFERARQYEETSYKGLFNFINFINKLKSGGGDMGSAKILSEHDNVVRIMSIHKSKGLEFPIVIVAGCGKKFNMMDLNNSILLHQELGFGPDLVDLEKRTIMPTPVKFAIRQKLRLETLSEEMRILYVAFTRAKEKLIMTGCIKDVEKACSKWCSIADTPEEKLPQYDMQQAGTYLDWLGPALARHELAVPIRQAALPAGAIPLSKNEKSCWTVKLWGLGAAATNKEAVEAGENIRQWLEENADAAEANIHYENRPDRLNGEAGSSTERNEENGAVDSEALQIIRRLEWQYPFNKLSSMPAKMSVTELKRRYANENEELQESAAPFIQPLAARPRFIETDKGLDAAGRGTIMHFVMQNIDLARLAAFAQKAGIAAGMSDTAPTPEAASMPATEAAIASAAVQPPEADTKAADASDTAPTPEATRVLDEELSSQLAAMVAKEQLTAAEAEAVRIPAISRFFRSAVGMRMLQTGTVHRETAFTIEMKLTDIYKELPDALYGNETMLLQGVIDCWFETKDGLVLLDYKTDYVPAGGSDLIRKRYKVQLDYYTRALEKITGKKVSETYLYLFHTGELLNC